MLAFDTATVTISVCGIELVALKKLAIVSHALASTLSPTAGREQTALANTLDDLLRRIEIAGAR